MKCTSQTCLVLLGLVGLVCANVDQVLTSPDVDVQAGFFPDSGYLRGNPSRGVAQAPAGYRKDGNSLNNVFSSTNSLASRLRRLMSRMPRLKTPIPGSRSRSRSKQGQVHVARPGFLTMFTGSKFMKRP
ncbi:uncharacterized protein LOC106013040 [Aplysia californica]|uniref:Uncharacterized protein LOC106013040 n=1 Tax=Aplysia californica TaxID=6500 RepID=A0ABM1A949_APLCA|nr:uncharacterized protein LOC106013040 [Aplysia californica]